MKAMYVVALNCLVLISLKVNNVYAFAETKNPSENISFFSSLMRFIGFLLVFGAVIFLAYYTTRLIANKTNQNMKNGNMEIIDFLNLSTSSKIMMVRVENNVYVIAMSGGNISKIDKLKYEDLDLEDKNLYTDDFDKQLKKIINSKRFSDVRDKFSKNRDKRDDI